MSPLHTQTCECVTCKLTNLPIPSIGITLIRTPPAPITADYINTLPPALRDYIHDLETVCDPNFMLLQVRAQQENIKGLVAMLRRVQREAKSLAESLASELKRTAPIPRAAPGTCLDPESTATPRGDRATQPGVLNV